MRPVASCRSVQRQTFCFVELQRGGLAEFVPRVGAETMLCFGSSRFAVFFSQHIIGRGAEGAWRDCSRRHVSAPRALRRARAGCARRPAASRVPPEKRRVRCCGSRRSRRLLVHSITHALIPQLLLEPAPERLVGQNDVARKLELGQDPRHALEQVLGKRVYEENLPQKDVALCLDHLVQGGR